MYKKPVKHSFKVFSENLKTGNIDQVILMYGIEQYLVKWAVDTLVKKICKSCHSFLGLRDT